MSATCEFARQTRDRLTFLEIGHSQLVRQVDDRYAASQEFEDFIQNRSEEDWVEVTGEICSNDISFLFFWDPFKYLAIIYALDLYVMILDNRSVNAN